MAEDPPNDKQQLDMLRSVLCARENEILMLRSELDRRACELQSLQAAMDTLERTTSACFDRLIRRLERAGVLRRR